MKIERTKQFEVVTIQLENPHDLLMMHMISANVQPRELASWHPDISQAQAADFLSKIHGGTQG